MNLFRRVFFSTLFLGGAVLLALDTAPVMNKPPLEAATVAQFAETMNVARAKVTAASTVLQSNAAAPEGKPTAEQALQAFSIALKQGSKFINAEKDACAQTGMPYEQFADVQKRLIQVRMYEELQRNRESQKQGKKASQMQEEAEAKLNDQLARLEAQVAKSEEGLKKAEDQEASRQQKLAEKIATQKERISKLEDEVKNAKNDKSRESKQQQLERARTQLAKYDDDQKKPSTRIPAAQERLEKDRKKAAQFKEQMPLVMAELQKSFDDIGSYQKQSADTMEQMENTPEMQQAKKDLNAFKGYEDLTPFALMP